MKKVKSVIGIKCFNKDLTCLGFQFELGKTYEIQGKLKLCKNGFHFHHYSQMKYVFDYYDNIPETRYCLVVGENVIIDDDKTVARKITIIKELSLREVIDIRKREMDKQGIYENQDEDCGVVSQKGWHGIASQTGFCGSAIQIGYRGSAMQTGDQGLAGQAGENGMAIQRGEYGSAIQTGCNGSAMQDGENGIAIATGINGKAMVLNDKGAIVIQNWIQNDNDNKWKVIGRLSAGVGDILPNGEIMKKNTWYWYENGVLKSKM